MHLTASLFLTFGTLLLAAPPQTQQADAVSTARRHTLSKADALAKELLSTLSAEDDECHMVTSLAATAGLHDLRQALALSIASCVNEESGSLFKFLNCLRESFEEFVDGLEELQDQHDARLELCTLLGGGIYDPDLDEDEFRDGVNHTYLPYLPGATWVYHAFTDEGLEEITVTVMDSTVEIDEIECIVVQDVVTLDGVLVEDTFDWYAQHADGAVWYMGEIAKNYEDGELVDIEGSWKAGEDGGQPGIVMMATPTAGTTYRQELLLGEAEDAGTVISVDETVVIGIGTYSNCVQTLDFTPLEPDAREFKYYAPGVGLVLEVKPDTGERLELISFTPGS